MVSTRQRYCAGWENGKLEDASELWRILFLTSSHLWLDEVSSLIIS